ncbi:hypothetical protein [Desulfopila aestuarii]|uniref:Methylenetetrahydrofolate reductase (NADPH) n=1 Tax=Desulfopila aestuarii DSM 18488 TaxID=1121416 RepID=A0A1M7YEN1_9BACT|nr:hypothetical protein [Desulfopila aestuarii]SHO51105.1 methylenetetrahydrofolate reductase (NADPH) [Desulfopila aestuarii DSM 18488]
MACRGRNRLVMRADISGAFLGIQTRSASPTITSNSLTIPESMGVFDIDSIMLIALIKQIPTEGLFFSGNDIRQSTKIYIGPGLIQKARGLFL